MSALAQLAHEKGARVRGYDASDGPFVRKLRENGIEVSLNGEQEITEDTVVYTGAIPPNNLQMDAARRAGKRLISRAEFLGAVAEEYPHVLSVAGCHGKTSCTAMSVHIFRSAGREFTLPYRRGRFRVRQLLLRGRSVFYYGSVRISAQFSFAEKRMRGNFKYRPRSYGMLP